MGQFEPVALGTPRSTSGAARGLLLGALASVAIAIAALSSAGVADATCAQITGPRAAAICNNNSQLRGGPQQQPGPRPSSTGVITIGGTSTANFPTASAAGNSMAVAESMVGTDTFGPYGCEDFVDAAYGRTTANGIGHDAALAFYQSLADRGLAHHEMPIPPGALVFSTGPDGDHVDISRGDGTYVSGGVQGLWPGYGDGHNVQILPTPNLGSWTLDGWVYPPW
jgi:hypothetical protein